MVILLSFLFVTALPSGDIPLDYNFEAYQSVQVDVQDYYDQEYLERSRQYLTEKENLYFLRLGLMLGILTFLVFAPPGKKFINRLAHLHKNKWVARILFVFILLSLYRLLIILPFSLYSSYFHEHSYGLSNLTLSTFFIDHLKGYLISLVITIPLVLLLYVILDRFQRSWYLLLWGVLVILGLIMIPLYHTVFIPLFNELTPLEDKELMREIITIGDRANLDIENVYIMDASKRTKKGNAFFTGIFSNESIVLYDNLLANHTEEEVLSVVAHEAGHQYHNHIWKGYAVFIVLSLLVLMITHYLIQWLIKKGWVGFEQVNQINSLPLIYFIIFILNLTINPLSNAISRHFERQADWASLVLTNDSEAFIDSHVELSKTNLGYPIPEEWEIIFLRTHPPTIERIRMAIFYHRIHQLSLPSPDEID